MSVSEHSVPALISAPRLTTLFASLLVSLGSGTNYAYSAWAPQLGSRLRITHTQLNIVGSAGNVGVYSFGPIWGRIVDKRGPRIPLVGAFLLLLMGYLGIRLSYDAGVPDGAVTISNWSFSLLVLCNYMTGAGGNGGLSSAVNSTAKSFPDRTRATATGLVIGGFGLSAFIFSTLAHVAFAGNTSAFLQLLALGTALPMVLGCFFIRPIPLPHEGPSAFGRRPGVNFEAATSSSALIDDSHASLLVSENDNLDIDESEVREYHHRSGRSRSLSVASSAAALLHSHHEHDNIDSDLPNVFGAGLWKNGDFWLLFAILSILSGTGLMYINNVGAMSQTLYAKNNPQYDEVEALRWQATQVSAISVMNFLGRIIIGVISDTAKNKFSLPRSYSLVPVSIFFCVSQVTAANIDKIHNLWLASSLLGLCYGSVFSLLPLVCLEWFGLSHFSENWGYLSLSPMIAGNIFMVFFGRNLDAHEAKTQRAVPMLSKALSFVSRMAAAEEQDLPKCLQGKECYVAALRLTSVMTFVAILLSIWAGIRDKKKSKIGHEPGKRRRRRALSNLGTSDRLSIDRD